MTANRRPLKAALLGLDHPHSSLLLRTLQNLDDVSEVFIWAESVGALRRRPAAAAPKIAVCTRNLNTILRRADIDFVIVCVRTNLAAKVAEQAMLAGKHVLAEKPAGLNATELRRLIDLAQRQRVQASVLYGQRVHPAVREARRLVASGAIGPVMSAEARMLTTQVPLRDPRSWLFRRQMAGGGILTWLGCHYLDLLHHITGDEIAAVSAHLATRSGERIDVEDVAALSFQFRSGGVGSFHAGYVLAHSGAGYNNRTGYDNYLAVNGRNGRIVWSGVTKQSLYVETPPVAAAARAGRTLRFRQRVTDSYGGASGEDFVRQFIGALRGEAALPATLHDAFRTARVIEATQRSASSGRLERVASSGGR